MGRKIDAFSTEQHPRSNDDQPAKQDDRNRRHCHVHSVKMFPEFSSNIMADDDDQMKSGRGKWLWTLVMMAGRGGGTWHPENQGIPDRKVLGSY